jgi:hypothetical protein
MKHYDALRVKVTTRYIQPTGDIRGQSGRLYGRLLPGMVVEFQRSGRTEYVDLKTLQPYRPDNVNLDYSTSAPIEECAEAL